MLKKIALWLLWIGFIAYAFLLAPPDLPNTSELIKNLALGQIEGINPLVVALFNLMGILPLIYSCMLFIDGRGQKIWAFPFALAAFSVGAFGLLPYLALRRPNPTFSGKKNLVLKLFDSRLLGAALVFGAACLVTYGLNQGDWSDFVRQWQTSRFIHVMGLDFCLLCLLFPILLGDDMARRGITDQRFFWAVALVPLLGPATYLAFRTPLPEQATTEEKPTEEELTPQA